MEHQVKVKQLTQKFNASDLTCMLKETNFTESEFIFKDIQKLLIDVSAPLKLKTLLSELISSQGALNTHFNLLSRKDKSITQYHEEYNSLLNQLNQSITLQEFKVMCGYFDIIMLLFKKDLLKINIEMIYEEHINVTFLHTNNNTLSQEVKQLMLRFFEITAKPNTNKDINDDMSLNLYRLLFIFSMCNQLTYCDIGKAQSDSFLKNIYYYNSFYISHPNYALMMFFQFMLFINIYIADQNGIKKRGNSLSQIKQQQQQPHLNLQITIYDNEHYGVAQWNDISRVLYMQCALKLFIIANLPKKVISLYNSISILITNPVYYVHENQIFPDFIPSFYSKVMNFSIFKLLTNANIKSIFKNINQFTVIDCFIHGYNTSDEMITILNEYSSIILKSQYFNIYHHIKQDVISVTEDYILKEFETLLETMIKIKDLYNMNQIKHLFVIKSNIWKLSFNSTTKEVNLSFNYSSIKEKNFLYFLTRLYNFAFMLDKLKLYFIFLVENYKRGVYSININLFQNTFKNKQLQFYTVLIINEMNTFITNISAAYNKSFTHIQLVDIIKNPYLKRYKIFMMFQYKSELSKKKELSNINILNENKFNKNYFINKIAALPQFNSLNPLSQYIEKLYEFFNIVIIAEYSSELKLPKYVDNNILIIFVKRHIYIENNCISSRSSSFMTFIYPDVDNNKTNNNFKNNDYSTTSEVFASIKMFVYLNNSLAKLNFEYCSKLLNHIKVALLQQNNTKIELILCTNDMFYNKEYLIIPNTEENTNKNHSWLYIYDSFYITTISPYKLTPFISCYDILISKKRKVFIINNKKINFNNKDLLLRSFILININIIPLITKFFNINSLEFSYYIKNTKNVTMCITFNDNMIYINEMSNVENFPKKKILNIKRNILSIVKYDNNFSNDNSLTLNLIVNVINAFGNKWNEFINEQEMKFKNQNALHSRDLGYDSELTDNEEQGINNINNGNNVLVIAHEIESDDINEKFNEMIKNDVVSMMNEYLKEYEHNKNNCHYEMLSFIKFDMKYELVKLIGMFCDRKYYVTNKNNNEEDNNNEMFINVKIDSVNQFMLNDKQLLKLLNQIKVIENKDNKKDNILFITRKEFVKLIHSNEDVEPDLNNEKIKTNIIEQIKSYREQEDINNKCFLF